MKPAWAVGTKTFESIEMKRFEIRTLIGETDPFLQIYTPESHVGPTRRERLACRGEGECIAMPAC